MTDERKQAEDDKVLDIALEVMFMKYGDNCEQGTEFNKELGKVYDLIYGILYNKVAEALAKMPSEPTKREIKKAAAEIKTSAHDWEADAIGERRGFIKGVNWTINWFRNRMEGGE